VIFLATYNPLIQDNIQSANRHGTPQIICSAIEMLIGILSERPKEFCLTCK